MDSPLNGPARVLRDVDRVLRTEADAEAAVVMALVRIGAWLQTGDDGTAHCVGCGKPLERFDPDCEVCMEALAAINRPYDFTREPVRYSGPGSVSS